MRNVTITDAAVATAFDGHDGYTAKGQRKSQQGKYFIQPKPMIDSKNHL